MEPGLRLLIQCVIEFAPVFVSLVQKRSETSLAKIKHPQGGEIQDFIQSISNLFHTSDSGGNFEQEKLLQQQLAIYHRQTQLKLAATQRETATKLPEIHKLLDNWPLRLYPSQILDSHNKNSCTPLRIFLAPPKIQFDQFDNSAQGVPEIELMLAEGLRAFLSKYYSLHSQVRPTEFLAGAWESKRFHSESSIKALFGLLRSEPTLILESEIDGDYLNFRIAYWGIGQENYYYQTISKIPYRQIIYKAAKVRALEWKKTRDELLALGESTEYVNSIGGDNVRNLANLEKEEVWKVKGIDVNSLALQYQVNRKDFEKLCQILTSCHCLVTAWVADAYHLVHHEVAPLLPEVLPSLLKDDLDMQLVQAIATGYKQIYQAIEDERRYWVPELALQLAQSLRHLPDQSWTKEQIDYSVNTWLQLRQILQPEGGNSLKAMRSALRIEDQEYIEKLREYFAALGDLESVTQVEELLGAIAQLKRNRQLEYANLNQTLVGHSSKISSVAITSDGQTIVSGCLDRTIKIWSLSTGKLIRTLTGHSGEVSSVALSPDGQILASGSYGCPRSNVKVWNLSSGKLLPTLLGHKKPVNFVAIAPDGQILASGSNKIKVWNLHKGERISTLWHSCSVNTAAFSPDSKLLASGSSDNKIRLWKLRAGELLRTLTGHSGEVKSIAIGPDGQTLVSGSADKTIKIWRLSTGELLHTLTGHSGAVNSVAISSERQLIASSSSDKTIKIWQVV
jgi:hypothetical protein